MSHTVITLAAVNWRKAYANYQRMQITACQLFGHPDATDEQKLTVANGLGRAREFLASSRRQITQHKDCDNMIARSLQEVPL